VSIIDLLAQRLRILGHPVRISLIQQLRCKPAAVHELVTAVGGTQQNISEHLLILNRAGIIAREKRGRVVEYRLIDPHVIPLLERARESVSHHVGELAGLIDSDTSSL
jgi:DNA-binding transcriptional ArsR family regulator